MRKFNWRIIRRIFYPAYAVPESAVVINRRWLHRQAFVLSFGSSILTLVSFPLYHILTMRAGETAILGHPHRVAVIAIAALCTLTLLFSFRLRRHAELFSFLNLVVLFACVSIDISFSERRRYTAIGLVPLFGSTFVFTNIRVMSVAYATSLIFFNALAVSSGRTTEIIVIYDVAYVIAWWMAMIRIRSLHRISFDQARIYDRQIERQRLKLARNLHDSLGGDLMQLSLQLGGDASRENMLDLAHAVIVKTKNLVYTLEPRSENENFSIFVASYAERLRQTGKFDLALQLESNWPQMRLDYALNIQAIFMEWMTNTLRHSRATKVKIVLRRSRGGYVLLIDDNGEGFRWNGKKKGSGLRNIALRTEIMKAKVFARRSAGASGTMFFLRGKFAP